ncbi:MAG TPA: hypothetical protein VLM11_05035 [Streptosporangiaceae bacterium]|nr:hypothetical protein [Streptosporangiaceae bacterium]
MDSSVARRLSLVSAAGLLIAMLAACSGADFGHAAAVAKPARRTATAVAPASPAPSAATPVLVAAASGYTGPHFSTPAAAMRYLTGAYNRDNLVQLHAVTTPQAFRQLTAMRSEAVNLELQSCVPSGSGRGDYVCTFRHDYPVSLHKSGHGSARILVAPAVNPGWYMYTLLDCG